MYIHADTYTHTHKKVQLKLESSNLLAASEGLHLASFHPIFMVAWNVFPTKSSLPWLHLCSTHSQHGVDKEMRWGGGARGGRVEGEPLKAMGDLLASLSFKASSPAPLLYRNKPHYTRS